MSLDGERIEPYRKRFTAWSYFHTIGGLFIATDLEDAEHYVEVTVSNRPIDKSNTRFAYRPTAFEDNPERFAGLYWYIGGILLIGDII